MGQATALPPQFVGYVKCALTWLGKERFTEGVCRRVEWQGSVKLGQGARREAGATGRSSVCRVCVVPAWHSNKETK